MNAQNEMTYRNQSMTGSMMDRARDWLAAFVQYYRLELAVDVQYRAITAIWMIGAILEPLIFLAVWSTVAVAQGGAVDGMTPSDFAAYYIAAFLVGEVTYSWNVWDYDEYVRNGDLSAHLMRPVHPMTYSIASNLSDKSVRMVMVLIATVAMALIFRPTFHFTLWNLVAFAPALLLATALYFACDFLVAFTAFWTTSTAAAARTWDTAFIFFSGYFAPLQLFPAAFQTVAWLLPFRWILAFPVELLLGQLTQREVLTGLAIQVAWLVILCVGMAFMWKTGVRRYQAVGG